MAGDLLIAHWRSMGLRIDGICRVSDVSTPVVSAVFDENGELAGAVADTHSFEKHLTPEWISRFQSQIKSASLVVLDANLSEVALQAACELAKEARVPVWFEPVSFSKSVRHSSISSHLMFVSPNEAELVAMSEGTCCKLENTFSSQNCSNNVQSILSILEVHIQKLLDDGIMFIVLTLGALGVVLCWHGTQTLSGNEKLSELKGNHIQTLNKPIPSNVCYVHFPALPASVVSVSGAGDCFVAGVLATLCGHRGLYESIAFGIAVARHAVQSEMNVPTSLCRVQLTANAQEVLSSARHL
ncbi:hypothetical protein KP509_34G039600 [Ceratopteris richardii]|nr:hypothetical protein KP509_34G039600 [Ceratopteris richardii]